ncbi:hypothetical protein [Marinobacterium sp. BA1]|uniref:hypothetical protein n=1 Tax=Marinobacterium sp. BA1 TaxID=3138931 RepID=UPI0032E7C53E
MSSLAFNFDFPEGRKAPLYCQFEGELGPQPAFITLNPDTREVSADYTSELGTGIPMTVWHNLELRFPVLASVSGEALVDFCREQTELFGRICDGFESVWDGSNYVGRYTEDAVNAQDDLTCAIKRELDDALISVSRVGVYLRESDEGIETEWPPELTLEQAAKRLYEEVVASLDSDWELYGDQDDVEQYLLEFMDTMRGEIPQAYKPVLVALGDPAFDEDDFEAMTGIAYYIFKLPQGSMSADAFDEAVSNCNYHVRHPLIEETEISEVVYPYVLVKALLQCDQNEYGVQAIGAELEYSFDELEGPQTELVANLFEYESLDDPIDPLAILEEGELTGAREVALQVMRGVAECDTQESTQTSSNDPLAASTTSFDTTPVLGT